MSKLLLVGLILFAGWLLLRKPVRRPPPKVIRPTYAEAEARSLLGVGEAADAEAIRSAHRRLMSAVHPDRGGSADLASRLNAARDLLLKR
ncbi:J domain-containing protein [Sphingomonas sp. GB1N7]|uniref:J domain-containing protein n=1 Tax=Parasphingomonas caseinilytica TaxID=3096158 RepID=UPI002FCB4C66